MTDLILDECIYSKKLASALKVAIAGIRVRYLGDGVSDNYIRSIVNDSDDSLIVTADRQLGVTLGPKALYLESKWKLKETVRIIKIWARDLL